MLYKSISIKACEYSHTRTEMEVYGQILILTHKTKQLTNITPLV